ncbi:hypothetical protein CEW87_20915 [Parazoarcus communis]|uniref:Sulfotransferase family protein n=1 Tax=Parazoarcus communis TaxID=41977 RepID=A0A2U8H7Q7_9RHOO|nr:sulfotransferase [Parazoarcus communis]AWI81600.1 hypothetical protein CEW87_20915 [Parazoarcus communis]
MKNTSTLPSEAGMRGSRLIIVGGAPRSGTSLFQSMMDSHRDVYGGPEFDHLTDIVNLRNRLQQGLHYGRITHFVDAAQIDDAMGQMVESLLYPVADRHGVSRLSEKTPMNVLVFKDLMTILPGAKFVHVIRDPRAVIMSMYQVAKRIDQAGQTRPPFLANLEAMALYINQCVHAGVEACESQAARAIIVRYEDLLSRTEDTMMNLLKFLDLPDDRAVLNPGQVVHESASLLKDGSDPWAGGRRTYTDPERENQDKWREDLDPNSIEVLNRLFSAAPVYAALDYNFD